MRDLKDPRGDLGPPMKGPRVLPDGEHAILQHFFGQSGIHCQRVPQIAPETRVVGVIEGVHRVLVARRDASQQVAVRAVIAWHRSWYAPYSPASSAVWRLFAHIRHEFRAKGSSAFARWHEWRR